jgi:hypothetical protein
VGGDNFILDLIGSVLLLFLLIIAALVFSIVDFFFDVGDLLVGLSAHLDETA